MKKYIFIYCLLISFSAFCQTELSSWLQNTTETGTYYMSGNPTAISNNILVNCQSVDYSNDYVYVTTKGIPAYATGPFPDGNPSQAQNQNAIFKFPRNPQANTGNLSSTTFGNIGVFINGVALFDYRDGVAWNPNANALCGGPGNPPCPGGFANMDWNRDAIPAEMGGFDCSKGHPAMGNYHHHQNPSAFKLDQNVISDVCNLYDADGLYSIDSTKHSPILGFAYDGFPIYGAYGYANSDGSGGVQRMESGYQLRALSQRVQGPDVSETYSLGYFREDYEFVSQVQEHFLDQHNGRFSVTPDYPDGTYVYFCTVDQNWNSTYPYAVGPTFYGVYANASVTSINENTSNYLPDPEISLSENASLEVLVFPNPTADLVVIQAQGVVKEDIQLTLLDLSGKIIKQSRIRKGQTLAYFDVQTVYNGMYLVRIDYGIRIETRNVLIQR